MKILAKVIHGSKLYQLDEPDSDIDYKGLFLPDVSELLLMRAQKNERKKVSENVEYENFALQNFVKLVARGEDVAITMLHASDNKVVIDSDIYKYLRKNRKMFYTKSLTGSLGYAKEQAFKYALRADRINAVAYVIEILERAKAIGVARIFQIYDDLPEGKYCVKEIEPLNRSEDKRFFECAGKKVTSNTSIDYAIDIYKNLYNLYGDRVKIANSLDGKDYKSISHAFRCGYQLRAIYVDGGFEYPLRETQFLRDVKFRKVNYLKDNLDEKLNLLISEVEELSKKSTFPEKIDQISLDKIIFKAYDYDIENEKIINR